MKPFLHRTNLPLEVWADINDFLRPNRRKVAELVNQSGDTEFTKIFMKLLHDNGKITLRPLCFLKSAEDNTACLWTFSPYNNASIDTQIAQTQMPDNIKNFKRIQIFHFDAQVLDFCRRLRTLLINDVKFYIQIWGAQDFWNNIAVILNRLAPFIGSIRSIYLDARCATGNFLAWAINEPAFQAAFARVKVLTLMRFACNWANETMVNFLPQWLTTDRAENEPKMAFIFLKTWLEENNQVYENIIMAIKENFLAAKLPSTFFVLLTMSTGKASLFQVDNDIGERLTVKFGRGIEIWRHKIGDEAETELGAWIDANISLTCNKYDDKLISLEGPTLGSFDGPQDEENAVAIAGGEKVNGNGEEEEA